MWPLLLVWHEAPPLSLAASAARRARAAAAGNGGGGGLVDAAAGEDKPTQTLRPRRVQDD